MIAYLFIAVLLAGLGPDSNTAKDFVAPLNAPHATVKAGQPAKVELKFRVLDGFHVNSNVPHSSYLIPTQLTLSAPTGIIVGKITYPAGTDMVLPFAPDEKLNVYSGDFTIVAGLSAARAAAPGQQKIQGELSYQACNDRACYPPKKLPVTIDVTVAKAKASLPQ
jgi:DsbC/DsbD-like thiol-disulfide interchange protein